MCVPVCSVSPLDCSSPPLSIGLFRQEYWCVCVCALSCVWLFVTPWTARLFCPWNFPGSNTGMGCHVLFQGIFTTQESNLYLLYLLQEGRLFTTLPPGKAQEYWSGLPSTSPGDLPDPGIEPPCPESLALQADSLPNKLSGKPCWMCICLNKLAFTLL